MYHQSKKVAIKFHVSFCRIVNLLTKKMLSFSLMYVSHKLTIGCPPFSLLFCLYYGLYDIVHIHTVHNTSIWFVRTQHSIVYACVRRPSCSWPHSCITFLCLIFSAAETLSNLFSSLTHLIRKLTRFTRTSSLYNHVFANRKLST